MEEAEGSEEELDSSSGKLEDEDEPPGFYLLTPGVETCNRVAFLGRKKSQEVSADFELPSLKEPLLSRTFARSVKKLRTPPTGEYRFYRRTPSRSKTGLPL